MRPQRILVAAKQLRLDRTSEGLCSFKFVQALTHAGHAVACVSTEAFAGGREERPANWPRDVEVASVIDERAPGGRATLARLSLGLAGAHAAGKYVDRKLNAAWAYGTGHSLHVWHFVERWRQAIRRAIERFQPDCIVVRGAGAEFEPHMAMLGWASPVPWVAYYNDPYPISLYPEPYRQYVPILARHQEYIHRQILAEATALIFPSRRLMRWVLTGGLSAHDPKAFVVPHIAADMTPPADVPVSTDLTTRIVPPGCFTLVHTGSLIHGRDPRVLIAGFAEFLGGDPVRRQLARLAFVGGVHRRYAASPEWRALIDSGHAVVHDGRVSYWQAREIARAADVLVVLEANCAESPFYPAKLADYLSFRRPILAVSPRQSATVDILGADYRWQAPPDDAAAVARRIGDLWDRWRDGGLAECLPPERSRYESSEPVVQARMGEVLEFIGSPARRRVS
jgi:hypothetical protein